MPAQYVKRHCHINLSGSNLGDLVPGSGRHARALPNLEGCGSKLFVHGSFEEVALVVECVVGRGVDVEEALY